MANSLPHRYSALSEKFDADSFDETTSSLCCPYCGHEVSNSRRRSGTVHIGWVVTFFFALTVVLSVTFWSWHSSIDRICLERTSFPSPALKSIPAAYKEVRFNGSIDFPSIYRGPPSPELDAAWTRVSDMRAINVKLEEADLVRLGVDVDSTVILPPEAGGGIMVDLEFAHQLHCVNQLRKVSYFEYYKDIDISFQNSPHIYRMHIDHCIEMLRQFVMCHSDVGVLTNHYIAQRDLPWPDFNTPHMCRDFDSILEWTRDNQVPQFQPNPPLKPKGFAKALAHPP